MTIRKTEGFTLIEVLISISILFILFATLYGTFDATYQAAERVEAEAESFRLARSGFYHLMRDVSMIYRPEAPVGQPVTNRTFEGTDHVRRIGDANFSDDGLRFTTLSHSRRRPDAPESDKSEVHYYLQDERLIREETLSNGRTIQEELGEPVWGFNVRYLNANGEWVDGWDTTQFPASVEVEMAFKSGAGRVRKLSTRMEIKPIEGGF